MKEIEGWLEEGDSYYYNSAYTKIINVFTKVLKKDSDNQHIINRLGDIFYAVKVYVKALDYFEKAIQLFFK